MMILDPINGYSNNVINIAKSSGLMPKVSYVYRKIITLCADAEGIEHGIT